MPAFLFWNVKSEEAIGHLPALAQEHGIDVVMVTETSATPIDILKALNSIAGSAYLFAAPLNETRPLIFIKHSADFCVAYFDNEHLTIRRLKFPGKPELLLCVVHLPSARSYDENGRSKKASEIVQLIRDCEQTAGHDRTLVVGDFNMNPFSDGLVSANAFNAVGVKRIAKKISRKVSFKEYAMFYNPMWSMFNDGESRSPGTYYYSPSDYTSIYHHIYDQLLLRPSIMDFLVPNSLSIIETSGGVALTNTDRVPSISDHLPIKFTLDY